MMNWISKNNILIVGLGLMGGSVAKGLKRLGFHVEGIDCSQAAIDFAVSNGIVDCGYAYPDEVAIRKADVILSKGQGNYESLSREGIHIFHAFLCKCDLFTKRYGVPKLTGIFTEEN